MACAEIRDVDGLTSTAGTLSNVETSSRTVWLWSMLNWTFSNGLTAEDRRVGGDGTKISTTVETTDVVASARSQCPS
jgi:hypothetical protein